MEVGWWALIVSGGSLLISGATYWRNRTARPRWHVDNSVVRDDQGQQRVRITVTNRGRGVAREVTLRPGWGLMALYVAESSAEMGFGDQLRMGLIFEQEDAGVGSFALSWYSEPKLHKLRTKQIKFTLRNGSELLPDRRVIE